MIKLSKILIFTLVIFYSTLFAQEPDISVQLKDIEAGKITKVKKDLVELQQKYPNNPSVMYLDALLSEDGQIAIGKYNTIVENYPKSKYADDALYKVYSYYYASGAYRMADGYLQQLKDTYPQSEYIAIAENTAEGKESDNISTGAGNVKETDVSRKNIVSKPVIENKNKDYKFTIQAGAFINLNNAKSLKKSLESAGYFTEIKEKSVGGSILNVVTVGQFATESEAKSELTAINKNFNLEGRIVPIN